MRAAIRTPLLLLSAGLWVAGCDASSDGPPAFTVQAVAGGGVIGESEGTPAAAPAPSVDVRLAPIRAVPDDPALAERFRLSQAVAAALSATTGERYRTGYYLVRVEPARSSIAFAPATCEREETCLFVVPNDSRVPGDGETGAIFFPVLDTSEEGPPLALRPLGLGGRGRLLFDGGGSDQATVDVAPARVSPLPLDGASRADLVRVVRGASGTAALLAVRRGRAVRVGVLDAAQMSAEVTVPEGTETVEVFLLRAE